MARFRVCVLCGVVGVSLLAGVAVRAQQDEGALSAERALAATVSEARMVETVRRLVGFGTRMYGTPSNHDAAAWLAGAFREAGLEVTIRQDAPRDWYQPISWEVRTGDAGGAASTALKTAWPFSGSPSGKGGGDLTLQAASGAVCLISGSPTADNTTGCAAVLYDGRASASGWPSVGRLRGTAWNIP